MSDDCRTRICKKGCMYPQTCPHEPVTGSENPRRELPDGELLRRLRLLYGELKQAERDFHAKENDEGECATYAAAERLREVVQEYLAGQVYSPNANGPQTTACGDCDPCLGGRPDQCAVMAKGKP